MRTGMLLCQPRICHSRETVPLRLPFALTDIRLDGADLLLGCSLPDLGHADHGARVHDPVPEGVRVVPAHGVHAPIRRPERDASTSAFCRMKKWWQSFITILPSVTLRKNRVQVIKNLAVEIMK